MLLTSQPRLANDLTGIAPCQTPRWQKCCVVLVQHPWSLFLKPPASSAHGNHLGGGEIKKKLPRSFLIPFVLRLSIRTHFLWHQHIQMLPGERTTYPDDSLKWFYFRESDESFKSALPCRRRRHPGYTKEVSFPFLFPSSLWWSYQKWQRCMMGFNFFLFFFVPTQHGARRIWHVSFHYDAIVLSRAAKRALWPHVCGKSATVSPKHI